MSPFKLSRLSVVFFAVAPTSAGLLCLMPFTGCGSKAGGPFGNSDPGTAGSNDGGEDATTGQIFTAGDGGVHLVLDTGTTMATGDSMCKGGFYQGSFGGLYSSHLTYFGANVPVTGDLQLTLEQMGSMQQMCTFQGESESCSDIFSIQNGYIQGTADGLFPFFCTLTGTLGCKERKLENGWIECTYCIGPLNDGGMSCALGGSGTGSAGDGSTGIGGQVAGPLTADYFYTSTGDGGANTAGAIDGGGSGPPALGTLPPPPGATPSDYDPGTWNGSEALAGYPGTGPLPDGGTLSDYISDAGYGRIGVPNDFGGYGWWYATYQHP
jgi:hypothetical protein